MGGSGGGQRTEERKLGSVCKTKKIQLKKMSWCWAQSLHMLGKCSVTRPRPNPKGSLREGKAVPFYSLMPTSR